MWIGTALTADYASRWPAYRDNLTRTVRNVEPFLVAVGFETREPNAYHAAATVEDPYRFTQNAPVATALATRWADVILLTDVDVTFQRDLDPSERDLLTRVQPGEIVAGWNARIGDDLLAEALRVEPVGIPEALAIGAHFQHDTRIFNGGFLAATRHTWRELHRELQALWPLRRLFKNPRCAQLLLCQAIRNLDLDVTIAPPSLSMHGHFPLPAGAAIGDGVATYHGRPVFARHALL